MPGATDPFDDVYEEAGRAWNVDPHLLRAVQGQESGHTRDPDRALSPAGAQGRMQLMPNTAKGLGVTNTADPVQNIFGGAKYLSEQLDKYGRVDHALAAYNAGPGRVDDYLAGRGKLPNETRAYVPGVLKRHQTLTARKPAAAAPAAGKSDDDPMYRALTGEAAPAAVAPDAKGSADPLFDALTAGADLEKPVEAAKPQAPVLPIDPEGANLGSIPAAMEQAPATLAPPPKAAEPPKPAAPVEPPADLVTLPDGTVAATFATPTKTDKVSEGLAGTLGGALAGAARGFGEGPLGVSDKTANALRDAGVFPSDTAGGPLRMLNEAAIRPAAAVGDLALRTGNALLGAYQGGVAAAGEAVGAPQLGRDLAALPEAFPTGGPNPAPRNPLAVAPRAENALIASDSFPVIRAEPPVSVAIPENARLPNVTMRAANDAPPPVVNSLAAAPGEAAIVPVKAEPLPPPGAGPVNKLAGEAAPSAGMGGPSPGMGPAPNSVGAAATPSDLTPMAAREAAASRATGEAYRLYNPRSVAGMDKTEYVPGVRPTAAEVTGNSDIAAQQKWISQQPGHKDAFDSLQAANNEARLEHYDRLAGTPTIVNTMQEARSAQADVDLAAAWGKKSPADAAPVVQDIDAVLAGPKGKLSAVDGALTKVRKLLEDRDGKLETDPEILYGARREVAAMLGKSAQQERPTLRDATAELTSVKEALDAAIEKAAPGYKQYLDNYAAASRPIDTMEMLQERRPGITTTSGNMTFGTMDKLMRDVVMGRQSRATNAAKGIDDSTMKALWDLHADTHRLAMAQNAGKVAGSDTNMLGQIGNALLTTGAHGAANALVPGIGSLVAKNALESWRSSSMARKARKSAAQFLDGMNYGGAPPNPLAGDTVH